MHKIENNRIANPDDGILRIANPQGRTFRYRIIKGFAIR
jgi:hypothetical protein